MDGKKSDMYQGGGRRTLDKICRSRVWKNGSTPGRNEVEKRTRGGYLLSEVHVIKFTQALYLQYCISKAFQDSKDTHLSLVGYIDNLLMTLISIVEIRAVNEVPYVYQSLTWTGK